MLMVDYQEEFGMAGFINDIDGEVALKLTEESNPVLVEVALK